METSMSSPTLTETARFCTTTRSISTHSCGSTTLHTTYVANKTSSILGFDQTSCSYLKKTSVHTLIGMLVWSLSSMSWWNTGKIPIPLTRPPNAWTCCSCVGSSAIPNTLQDGMRKDCIASSFSPPDPITDAFGFIDPASVIRGAHLIPGFAYGPTNDYLGPSFIRQDPEFEGAQHADWRYFYVNMYVCFSEPPIFSAKLLLQVRRSGHVYAISWRRDWACRYARLG
jgi:hypothetical protein